jgi:hypothetical protein
MVNEPIPERTTVHQQFEKIIESFQQEAVADARALGFSAKSSTGHSPICLSGL